MVAYLQADTPVVECDADLLASAKRVASSEVVFGTVASADAWNRDSETILQLAGRHQSVCEDMEAAAIGLVCARHRVPFLTIKDISNNELAERTSTWEQTLNQLGRDQIARRAAAFAYEVLRDQAYSMSRR